MRINSCGSPCTARARFPPCARLRTQQGQQLLLSPGAVLQRVRQRRAGRELARRATAAAAGNHNPAFAQRFQVDGGRHPAAMMIDDSVEIMSPARSTR
jgi:hypothetical protein